MSSEPSEIKSPCIGVCTMSDATGLCLGCFRTIEEIREWWDMTNAQRGQVLEALEARQAAHLSFD